MTPDFTDSTDGRGWNEGFHPGRAFTSQVCGDPKPSSCLSVSSVPSVVPTAFSRLTARRSLAPPLKTSAPVGRVSPRAAVDFPVSAPSHRSRGRYRHRHRVPSSIDQDSFKPANSQLPPYRPPLDPKVVVRSCSHSKSLLNGTSTIVGTPPFTVSFGTVVASVHFRLSTCPSANPTGDVRPWWTPGKSLQDAAAPRPGQ